MNEKRRYILRRRKQDGQDEYVPVTNFTVQIYRCGLRAGDRLRLKRSLAGLDEAGVPTGLTHEAGQLWTALTGAPEDPETLWLQQPDGELHSWSDDRSIFEYFEKMERAAP
ncbi:MAG: hypothetical protein Q7W02_19955 [Candidatus Rokubacteria bacterium]|nr:hypothetical protein [Candidatus Rokubacteria bacterium]